ncbi:MAG: hypothetical protein QM308_07655 [Bacillota bacterium]|nr:hypothetical protein [Bacillota bacterium]
MRRSTELSPMTLFIPLLILGSFIRKKSKKAGAIYDLIWSIGILVWGVGVMNDGGTIVLFGSIKLPPIAFIGIIVLVIISEIIALISAIRQAPIEAEAENKRVEEQQQQIAQLEATAERLAAPSALYIVHKQGIIGSANKIRLTLNGRELTPLGSGGVVQTELAFAHNRLSAVCEGVALKEIEFDAPASGPVRVDVLFKTGTGIVLEQNPNTDYREPQPGKKRVRSVKIGLVLWSILNFWCYFLGIVPLVKTLRAAKHPFDDIAQQRLNSAKKWNLWMSGIFIVIVLFALLYRLR